MSTTPQGTTKVLMRTRFWNWMKSFFGEKAVTEASLDATTKRMREGMLKKKRMVSKAMAMSLSKEHELKEKVNKIKSLQATGQSFLSQGREAEAQRVAEQIAEAENELQIISETYRSLKNQADDLIVQYKNEADEVEKRLKESENLKALAELNLQRREAQSEFESWNDDAAKNQYDQLASKIRGESKQLDAAAMLEGSETARLDLEVREQQKALKAQAAMEQMRASAATPETTTETSPISEAEALLQQPSFRSLSSAPAPKPKPVMAELVQEEETTTTPEKEE